MALSVVELVGLILTNELKVSYEIFVINAYLYKLFTIILIILTNSEIYDETHNSNLSVPFTGEYKILFN